MNEDEFESIKLLKLKYKRWDQINQTFGKIGSPKKLAPHSLVCRIFNALKKVLLNNSECIEI